MNERLVIFPAIEKTGTRSVLSVCGDIFGQPSVFLYNNETERFVRLSDISYAVNPQADKMRLLLSETHFWPPIYNFWKRIKVKMYGQQGYLLDKLPQETEIIYGHIAANKFDGIFNNPFLAIVFREPLERMRSQFEYWKTNQSPPDWRIRIPYAKDIGFEDYVLLEKLQNCQTQVLAGKDLKEIDVIGTTDSLGLFTHVLIKTLVAQNICRPTNLDLTIPHLNRTSTQASHLLQSLKPSFVEKFRQFHTEDYRLYKRVCNIVDNQR